MSVHITSYFMYNKRNKKKIQREERKLYCSSQDVAEPSLIFLIVKCSLWEHSSGEESSRFFFVCLF